jgi:hypothetical protein
LLKTRKYSDNALHEKEGGGPESPIRGGKWGKYGNFVSD